MNATSEQKPSPYPDTPQTFARRVLIATLVVASVVLVLFFLWYAAELLMVVFAALLISIILRGFSRMLRRRTALGHSASLALVLFILMILSAVTVWLLTGRIGGELSALQHQLPHALENVSRALGHHQWVQNAIDGLPALNEWLASRSNTFVSRLTGLASSTLSAMLNVLLLVLFSLYLAAQPGLYAQGVRRLLPLGIRHRAEEVMDVLDQTLWRWFGGRFCLMFLTGGLTTIGLWLLGIPLALSLGVIAGLLSIIPNFGPWVATVPAVLIGFLQGPQQALQVALLYLVLQSVDGYVFTPLIDRKSVELPPVLTIAAQVIMGVAFGFLGILIASPLTATVMILVKMLYVEDILGDRETAESTEAEKPDAGK